MGNRKVQAHLTEWCINALVEALSPSSKFVIDPKSHMMAALSTAALVQGLNSHEGYKSARQILRGSLEVAKAASLTETHEYACIAMIESLYTLNLGEAIDSHARLLEVLSWNTIQSSENAPPGWDVCCYPMTELLIAYVCVVQGRFLDAMLHLDAVEAKVVAERNSEAMVQRMHLRMFWQTKGTALFGLGRTADGTKLFEEAKALMERNGDTHGS